MTFHCCLFEQAEANFLAGSVEEAVQCIIPYLEDTSEPSQDIYFDGWSGLGASAVLISVAEDPPPSLRNKFDIIINIDCSRWKNRRTLQRTIAQKLKLPPHVMAIFDRKDEDDDFGGVDEDSRVEITDAGREIHQALQGQRCLVVFHNGSNSVVDLNDFGIPQPADRWSNVVRKILWTFRGRLHVIPGMKQITNQNLVTASSESTKPGYPRELSNKNVAQSERVDKSHIYLYSYLRGDETRSWNELVHKEATEIAQYTVELGVTPETATMCCKYLLLLNSKGANNLDYNWATHLSNYWVCDGIIQESPQDKAWKVAAALHKEIRLEDYSSYTLPSYGYTARWIVSTSYTYIEPETRSFFLANKRGYSQPVPSRIFQSSKQLRVLKLSLCSFSFSSPPFLHCQSLRFLGLDSCKDEPKELEQKNHQSLQFLGLDSGKEQQKKLEKNKEEEEDEEALVEERRKMLFFQSLWVLDICLTDWELTLFPNIIEIMSTNMREINIKKGRIWHNNLAWRRLRNIHKLRVIEPTYPWETGSMDDFTDMGKLELLDLTGNSTTKVLPSLSGATVLSTLVLDGCVGLEHVCPEALPPSLETFSLDAGEDHNRKARISRISVAGCARLANFRLRGSLPNLELLDLSNTSVKVLDLKDEVVQAPCLEHVILLGCERLRSVLWPKNGMPKLMVLRIDTRGGTVADRSKTSHESLVSKEREGCCNACVCVMDMRFIQSLMVTSREEFFCNTAIFNLSLCLSSTSKDDGQNYNKMGLYSTGQSVGSLLHKSSTLRNPGCTYRDVNFDHATIDHVGSSEGQFQPLAVHVEIGEGISNINVVTPQGIRAVIFLMNKVQSLLVHDNCSITTVIPQSMMSIREEEETISWSGLKWCRVERCPKLDTVFTTNDEAFWFSELEIFWAADLLMTRRIWSKERTHGDKETKSFAKLRDIHLHSCPRLTSALQLSWFTLSNLETLCIIWCGNLTCVFPVEAEYLNKISAHHEGGALQFAQLKHIYLHDLPKLHQICEAKMFAPKLETIWLRGCWSLKRLPATVYRAEGRPVIDCEKDWWNKLEWDGKEVGHHPSLFEPRHSKYYKKTLIKRSVLR
ncbi:hypothetical protein ACP70R_018044 [Stipagrostis hirtigluma subsp. patula]